MARSDHAAADQSLPKWVSIGALALSIEDVVAIARRGASAHLAPEAHMRPERSRCTVEHLALGERPIYGLTTALGAASTRGLRRTTRRVFSVAPSWLELWE
jgi:histidine ammonia-lyase